MISDDIVECIRAVNERRFGGRGSGMLLDNRAVNEWGREVPVLRCVAHLPGNRCLRCLRCCWRALRYSLRCVALLRVACLALLALLA